MSDELPEPSPSETFPAVTGLEDNGVGTREAPLEVYILIIIGFSAILVLLCLYTLQYRYFVSGRSLKKLPRKVIPVRPNDLPRSFAQVVRHENMRTRANEVEPDLQRCGQPGWGRPGTQYGKVHFRTSIAKSHTILEQAAVHRDPSLTRHPAQSVRDYLLHLRRVVPNLNPRLCNVYVENYERARFGNDEFSFAEYTEFIKQFLVLAQAFEGDD